MPPKIKKFPKQVLPEADANVLSDVLLRYTTSDLPDVELPPGCAQAKGAWLASFHKSVTRKLRESCADDDEVSASASSSDEGALCGAFGRLASVCFSLFADGLFPDMRAQARRRC